MFKTYFTFFVILLVLSCSEKQSKEHKEILPPKANKKEKISQYHGEVMIDPYFWLRGAEKKEVLDYLTAENEYTSTVTKHFKKVEEDLFNEMKGRIPENDTTAVYKTKDYYYYSRTEAGKQYKFLCRKKGSLKEREEVMLDINALAKGHEFYSIGDFEVSPDEVLLGFPIDTIGNEIYTIKIKNLSTGEILADEIRNSTGKLVWGNDNRTIYYVVLDETFRAFKVFKHTLGTSQDKDVLLFHEKDRKFEVGIEKSNSRRYIFLTSESSLTSEVNFLEADKPESKVKLIQQRINNVKYFVDHSGDNFYLRTNIDSAINYKLMSTKITLPGKENWRQVLPYNPDKNLIDIKAFKNHLVITERIKGLTNLRILDFRNNKTDYVVFPDPTYWFSKAYFQNYDNNEFRYYYSSLVRPTSVFHYNFETRDNKLAYQEKVIGNFNSDEYKTERIFATASDGAKIPLSIAYKKNIALNGNNPLYLEGYGSYGYSLDPYFQSDMISLMDRGFVFAKAHIRGGGEMGKEWHEEGRFLKKKNTFNDFIASAEFLIKEKYTSKDKLVIEGASAGGLLMGAVTNMRPDLFKLVVAKFPFVDVINTMSDSTLPLTIGEYEEWGNPADPAYFRYMKSYSPYDNVRETEYPNMLITTGLNDSRVGYWEPAKWTAKLRSNNKSQNKILLKTQMSVGHFGPSGRYDYLKEIAFEYAFIFDVLGVKF